MINLMLNLLNKTTRRQKTGFTLIELLVAMTIIGILAVIGLRAFTGAQAKSRDAKRKNDLSSIARALEVYYNDYNRYPTSNAGIINGCGPAGTTACPWGSTFATNGATYMQLLPNDPKGSYFYVGSGSDYQLYARLENLEDNAAAKSGGSNGSYDSTTCRPSGETGCNYGISSSNSSLEGTSVE